MAYVCNRGRAGAVEGQRVKAAQAKARQDHVSQPAAQAPAPSASSRLRDVRSFFHGNPAGGEASGNGDQGLHAVNPAARGTKRPRKETPRAASSSGVVKQVEKLAAQLTTVMRLVGQQDLAARASGLEPSHIPLAEGGQARRRS